MTKSQAAQIQAKWQALGHPQGYCWHLNLEMEQSEAGYLTGNFHCTDCGEHLVKKD
jgi:hypothetical protein